MSVTLDPRFIQERSDGAEFDGEPRLIPFSVGTPEEFRAICLPASSLSAFIETRNSDGAQLAVIAFALSAPGGGLYVPMKANNVRSLAASLTAMADKMDGGKGKQ